MCGIFGVFHFDRTWPVPAQAAAAVDCLTHRGPDERGVWMAGPVLLGMRRLSIIDLAGGQQPIWNEDQTCCIIYNGELYNFLDLRPALQDRGHRFRTRSDTEVILHAYEEWGPDFLRRLNGMFALAIWDARRHLLLLARDRLGEKPLYLYRDSQRLIFASEIKAILHDPTVPRRLAWPGMANYLAFGHATGPVTIYEGITKLQPGHYLLATESGAQIVQYWDVGEECPSPVLVDREPQAMAAAIRDLLDDSVRRRMVADVPVGAFLSGGVDSSAVVALMRRHATGPLKTFSLGFAVGGEYNELGEARQIARHFQTDHHELEVSHLDLAPVLQTLVYHYDEPFADSASFPLYLLSRFAREQVKVVLAGDGGDELFGGYRRYIVNHWGEGFQRLPAGVQMQVRALVERLPRQRRLKRMVAAWSIPEPALRYAAWLWLFTPEAQAALLQPDVWTRVADYNPAWLYPYHAAQSWRLQADDPLNRLLYMDLKSWLVDTYLEKTDKATMACSLEARLPLLDHRLVELAFQIPGRHKVRGLTTKRILKEAVRGLVPNYVLRRPKHGFAVPTDPWLRGPLREFARDLLFDGRMAQRGYWQMETIGRLWQEHQSGRHVWSEHLWVLLCFELWHRSFLDARVGHRAPAHMEHER